ncbi:MAG: carbohydrate porin [Deltaproteobacteria bacterium]|nr:carbohydrate porin [Deltaproteobacteria bacterium]
MKKFVVRGALSFLLVFLLLTTAQPALALHPEFRIPERATSRHPACQEIMRLAKKYEVEAIFPKGFEGGEISCPRIDLAVAVQLITEKMAAKVAKEGPEAIDKKDLATLSEIREELQGEMLLVQARTFRQQTEELGTRLHALTKRISLSGGLTGILTGSRGNKPRDHADVVGRGDLLFNFRVGENTIAVVNFSATGGDGIDAHIPNFSTLNDAAGSTDSRVIMRKAFVEHTAFNDRLIMTVGKIGLEDYFDANNVANDGHTQFLSTAFVNSAVLGQPGKGPGMRVQAKLAEPLTFSVGYGSGDADSADILDHPYVIAEADYTTKIDGLEGNYRFYASMDGALPGGVKLAKKNAFGFGTSIDQQLTGKLTVFARYGRRDDKVFRTKSAWSTGFQYAGLFPARKDDMLGFAYGQIQSVGTSSDEKLAELSYKVKINDQIAITPLAQYLINPEGNRDRDNVLVMGLRTRISF